MRGSPIGTNTHPVWTDDAKQHTLHRVTLEVITRQPHHKRPVTAPTLAVRY